MVGDRLRDVFGDVFGQERARDVTRNSVYELRRNLNDERFGTAFQAVFVTEAVSMLQLCEVWPQRLGLYRQVSKTSPVYRHLTVSVERRWYMLR